VTEPASEIQLPVVARDDFYRSLRRRIRDWLAGKGKAYRYADMLWVAPDLLHLLCRLVVDRRVPSADKARLAAAIAYFVSVFDFMPEFILGPVGYLDDVALAAFVLHKLIGEGLADVAKEHWAGDGDLLQVLQRILDLSNQAIGSGLWSRLTSIVGGAR
jgi:uncharacterized membrane protein YkvA (DUF1232 family)